MSRAVLALGALLGAAPLPAPSPPAAAEGRAVVLPSSTCRGYVLLPITLDADPPVTLQMLYDTGSAWTFVDPAAAARLLGGRAVAAGRIDLVGARIGSHSLPELEARVLPMGAIGRAVGHPIDGILAFSAFRDALLTLDYPAAEVRVARGRLPAPDGRRVFRYAGRRRPHLAVRLGGRRVRVLLDSGANGSFLFRPGDRLAWASEPRPAQVRLLVSGATLDRVGRLAGALAFGPLTFERPLATVAPRERWAGWRALRHLAITFDQRRRRVRMDPAAEGPVVMDPLAGVGLGYRPRPAGLEVVAVLAGSPAAAAGLAVGDLVVAIDGTPVYERDCGEVGDGPAGERRLFTYLRDGGRREAALASAILVP